MGWDFTEDMLHWTWLGSFQRLEHLAMLGPQLNPVPYCLDFGIWIVICFGTLQSWPESCPSSLPMHPLIGWSSHKGQRYPPRHVGFLFVFLFSIDLWHTCLWMYMLMHYQVFMPCSYGEDFRFCGFDDFSPESGRG